MRASGGSVVFIQHDGPPGDPHHPDAPGWHLLPDLRVRPDDTIIRKQSSDAFLHTSLDDFLLARATDKQGTTQPDTVPFNTGGYLFWAAITIERRGGLLRRCPIA